MIISFDVFGLPAPQGSKRHVGNGVMIETGGDKLKAWRDAVRVDSAAAMAGRSPLAGPVQLWVQFLMPRPKGHYRTGRLSDMLKDGAPIWHSSRPDIDKLLRSTLDGLKAGGVYLDDSQVAEVVAKKRYTGGAPMATIHITDEDG